MNFNLKEHTVLFTVAGSRAYGIHTESSDLDTKGVVIPPARYYTGMLDRFEQAEDVSSLISYFPKELQDLAAEKGCEGVAYEWRKFLKLAADANPNILDVLFCDEEDVIFADDFGILLRENRDLFLSLKAKHTYSGYAISQLKRINTHRRWLLSPCEVLPTRESFGLASAKPLPDDDLGAITAMIQKKMDQWEIDYRDMLPSSVIAVQGEITEMLTSVCAGMALSEAKYLAAARQIGVDDNMLDYLQRERAYANARKDFDNYQKWKKSRNAARAEMEAKYGYDCKHAGHLFRLMVMAREIIEGKGVIVNRKGIDADVILDIRKGAWSYERVIEFAEEQDKILLKILPGSPLPKVPDLQAIEALCQKGITRSVNNDR